MGTFRKIKGDLIELAKQGEFDVVAHGCNCFCTQGAGLAPQMVKAFSTDKFRLEQEKYKGNYNKLGTIDYEHRYWDKTLNKFITYPDNDEMHFIDFSIVVVNAYTQFQTGRNASSIALRLILDKMNHIFEGQKIVLPFIGAGIGGLRPEMVELVIKARMQDCDVTLVEYNK